MGRLVAIYTDGTAYIFSTEFGAGGPSKLLENDHRCASLDGGGSGEYGLQMASVSVSTLASVECDVEYDSAEQRKSHQRMYCRKPYQAKDVFRSDSSCGGEASSM